MSASPLIKTSARCNKTDHVSGAGGQRGRRRVPRVTLFEHEDVVAEWRRLCEETADDTYSDDQGDAKRKKTLKSIIEDSRKSNRDLRRWRAPRIS